MGREEGVVFLALQRQKRTRKKKIAICNDRKVANGTNLVVKTSGQTSISTVLQKGYRRGRRAFVSYVSLMYHATPHLPRTESDLMAVQ